MNAPTQEQIEEARCLRQYVHERGQDELEMIALIVAYIRTRATNDALERAAARAWALLPEEHNFRIQTAIRAMKVKA